MRNIKKKKDCGLQYLDKGQSVYEDERKQVQDRKKISIFVCTLCVPEESKQGWPLSSTVAEQNVLGRDECSWRAEKRLMECTLLMKEKSRPS